MTGIFYGSTTGNTESLAKDIASRLGVKDVDIYDVSRASPDAADKYDLLLLGSSTWGLGDLQDDREGYLDKFARQDLSGKKVALFGCGDSASYPDTFCDSLGIIKDALGGSGCTFVGEMDAAGYSTTDSRAFERDKVIGLVADDDEPGRTEQRTEAWISAIGI